jgi:hypothetical protein
VEHEKEKPAQRSRFFAERDILVRFGAREPQADKNVRAPPIEI